MATALIGFTFIYVVSLFICVIVCYLLVSIVVVGVAAMKMRFLQECFVELSADDDYSGW